MIGEKRWLGTVLSCLRSISGDTLLFSRPLRPARPGGSGGRYQNRTSLWLWACVRLEHVCWDSCLQGGNANGDGGGAGEAFGVRRALAAFTRRGATMNTANRPQLPPCSSPEARRFCAAITGQRKTTTATVRQKKKRKKQKKKRHRYAI